ncbi:MAG: choice-of-anchor tandem repeat NxxGxxAF-containing protein [Planctomycetota bacterium]
MIVAQTGDALPGGVSTLTTVTDSPTLNDLGQIGFTAETSGGFRGAYSTDPLGQVREFARTGQPAPGTSDTFSNLRSVSINEAGQSTVFGTLSQPDDRAVYRATPTGGSTITPTLIAAAGSPGPGGVGTFGFVSNPSLNESGQVGFRGQLTGSGVTDANDFGLFRSGSASALVTIAREGDAIPVGSGFIDEINFAGSGVNNLGQIAFRADLTGGSVTTPDSRAIYIGDGSGPLTQVARSGQLAPDGDAFLTFGSVTLLNNVGDVAFTGFFDFDNDGFADADGIYVRDAAGTTVKVVRDGDTAPNGVGQFRQLGTPVINDAGQVAFRGSFSGSGANGSNNVGIYRGDGFSLLMRVARKGDAAPNGGTFDFFRAGVAINEAGQVAFYGNVEEINGDIQRGIFFYDDLRGLLEVVRTGDTVNGVPIETVEWTGGGSLGDEFNGFNELGQIAYRYSLVNGDEGIAVWSIPPIPEPLSALGGATLLGMLTLRRRAG